MAENICTATDMMTNVVAQTDIQALLVHFSKTTYRPQDDDPFANDAMRKCIALFRSDYTLLTINNSGGELSTHYPGQLLILEHENHPHHATTRTTNTIYENVLNDEGKLLGMILKGRRARCRARFPVPVIIYKGKYVCRSATLSGGPEIYGRSGYDYLFNTSEHSDTLVTNTSDEEDELTSSGNLKAESDWQLFGRVRTADIKLLKSLNVGVIVDFMVEKKKVKFGLNVTSSEKVDKENRYADFSLISLPYPGCEFFKDYRDNNYNAEGLVFNWSQAYVDANISLPPDCGPRFLNVDWSEYKSWDLVTITQNYMRLLLRQLRDGTSSILIHCISGWDRTPLFVSLLRLSLWADGLIHQQLDAQQILYLTIAYDWMLFGHHLTDRLGKGEEIFFFCFNILKQLVSDEYSLIYYAGQARGKSKEKERNAVNRTDSDTLLDVLILDGELRGSNISLNSVCSSLSNMSQHELPLANGSLHEDFLVHNNGNGNIPDASSKSPTSFTKRTSPVSVPNAMGNHGRQRNESSSSASLGSWQMITGAGSIRDSYTPDSNGSGVNANVSSTLVNSSSTLIDDDNYACCYTADNDVTYNRKNRLLRVRETFLNCYHRSIGFKFRNDSSLGQLLGNFAEKVGLGQRQ